MPKSKLIRFTTLFLFLTFDFFVTYLWVFCFIFDFLFAVLVLRTLVFCLRLNAKP